jgi:hypothetical protein
MVMKVFNGVEFQVVNKMEAGVLKERTPFTYKGKKYILHKFVWTKDTSYSIGGAEMYDSTMNIGKTTKRYISLYTYDLMGQRTQYKMALEEMMFEVEEENN